MQITLYTIGHSNLSAEEFFCRINKFDIDTIVDVRRAPYSRYVSHFNKDTMSRLCESKGIKYVFMGQALGGRADFIEILNSPDFMPAVEKVVDLARHGHVCLMCGEARPEKCHRTMLLEKPFEERGVTVLHILPDGSAVDARELRSRPGGQMSLF